MEIGEIRDSEIDITPEQIDDIVRRLQDLCEVKETEKFDYYYLHSTEYSRNKPYSKNHNDRVTQFLRHIARVLYIGVTAVLNERFSEIHENDILVEVQIMLVKTQTNVIKDMFVSFNAKNTSADFHISKIVDTLNDILKNLYDKIDQYSGELPRDKKSEDRSLYKLNKHCNGESCKAIFDFLKLFHPQSVCVLQPNPNNRHAEETLCDKAVELREADHNVRFQIQGKMRPCKSCAGRMKSIGIEKYNRNSGFFFVDCLKKQLQKKDFPAAIKSLELLRDEPCYSSTSPYLYSYDTGSDTDQGFDIQDRGGSSFMRKNSNFIRRAPLRKSQRLEQQKDRKRKIEEGSSRPRSPVEKRKDNKLKRENEKQKTENKKGRRQSRNRDFAEALESITMEDAYLTSSESDSGL